MRSSGPRCGPPSATLTLGSNEGLRAEVLESNGTLVGLTWPLAGSRIPLILALPDLDAYHQDRNYSGQLIGRYANRIADAAFELGGRRVRLESNDGRHALHGAGSAFGKAPWRPLSAREGDGGFLRLWHLSPDGTGGFPGNLAVVATVSVEANTLRLDFEATTDAPTPVSFTWHPYFNLSGRADVPISSHLLRLAADSYLPVNPSWIPTGEIASVSGARFDFRSAKPIGELGSRLNHCFVRDLEASVVAELCCPETGIAMELRSDAPGLQVYDGYFLREQYPGWHGLALEPGAFPDAPNHANFPDTILRPGATHRSFISYTFKSTARTSN